MKDTQSKEVLVQPYALQLLRKNIEAMLQRKRNIQELDLRVHVKKKGLFTKKGF